MPSAVNRDCGFQQGLITFGDSSFSKGKALCEHKNLFSYFYNNIVNASKLMSKI